MEQKLQFFWTKQHYIWPQNDTYKNIPLSRDSPVIIFSSLIFLGSGGWILEISFCSTSYNLFKLFTYENSRSQSFSVKYFSFFFFFFFKFGKKNICTCLYRNIVLIHSHTIVSNTWKNNQYATAYVYASILCVGEVHFWSITEIEGNWL